jgi:acyl-CoA dehydrogenase family protein 9
MRASAGYVEKHIAELAQATQRMIMKHKREILNRQLVVERLADMAIELYARAATMSHTQQLIDERGADACSREIALTELFCLQSGRRFRALRLELDGDAGPTLDDLRLRVAASIRASRGYDLDDALMDVDVPPLPAWGLRREDQERKDAAPGPSR